MGDFSSEFNKVVLSEVERYRKVIDERADVGTFFEFFNNESSLHDSLVRGSWDFSIHFADKIAKYVYDPEKLVALEIGYGGGRILHSAARHFNFVYGVDIHNQKSLVEDMFYKRGIENFRLFRNDGYNLPIDNSCINFVYSFVVFQHLEHIEVIKMYLREIERVLTNGGIGLIYFGRWARFSLWKNKPYYYWLDLMHEFAKRYDYLAYNAELNYPNIRVSRRYLSSLINSIDGLRVKSIFPAYVRVPNGYGYYGAQWGCLFERL